MQLISGRADPFVQLRAEVQGLQSSMDDWDKASESDESVDEEDADLRHVLVLCRELRSRVATLKRLLPSY